MPTPTTRPRLGPRGLAAALALLVALAAPPRSAHAMQKVVPAGQERLLLAMLQGGGASDLPAGCALEQASVLKTYVDVHFICAGSDVRLDLHPEDHATPPDAPTLVGTTTKFTVLRKGPANAALEAVVLGGLRAKEGRFHWMRVRGEIREFGGLVPTTPESALEPDAASTFDPELVRLHEKGQDHLRSRQLDAAVDTFTELADKDPAFGGVLGMIVSTLAQTQPDRAAVDRRVAAADAAPTDPLVNFIAGVSAHYSAHYRAETPEQKRDLYATTIRMLDRTRPSFDFEPRVYIYLGVSHFRLGHQDKAEALIEKSIEVAAHDPDAYYCRAEIFHRKNLERSLKDLDIYLEMVGKVKDAGGDVAETKMARVREMQDYLRRVAAGQAELTEVFDPLAGDTPSLKDGSSPKATPGGSGPDASGSEAPAAPARPTEVTKTLASPSSFGAWVLGAAALLALAAVVVLARRRRDDSDAT